MATLPDSATLSQYQAYIIAVAKERGWDSHTAIEKMLLLTEEVGEVAKAIRKESGTFGYQKPLNSDHIGEELVDVFNFILDIANEFGIDMEQAFKDKWEKNNQRTWN